MMDALIDESIPTLAKAIAAVGIEDSNWTSMIGRSRESNLADISLPCFAFSKQLGQSPDTVAQSIVNAVDVESNSAMGEVIASGGYVNIRASISWLANRLLSPEAITNSEHIMIEHTSANPNGPFHVGRARNAILGDTFVRMYRAAGKKVTAEYYVDDMGKQVGILCWAIENLSETQVNQILESNDLLEESSQHSQKADHQRVKWYQAANALKTEDSSIDEGVTTLVQLSEEADEDVLNRFDAAYQPVLDGMLETLGRMGITFDSFTKESAFIIDGSVEVLMNALEKSELHGTAENGAHFLELESKGIKGKSTKFYYRRGDGSSLYATRDLAYHQWKWTQAEQLMNILGEDHKLQSRQVSIALDELNIPSPDVVFYAFTKLADGKMSTRRGNVVYMDDLLDEAQIRAQQVVNEIRSDLDESTIHEISEAVGVSATRFNIARISPEKGITFRWEDALSLDKASAPFIMYSHARACSISRRAGHQSLPTSIQVDELSPTAIELIRRMAKMQNELNNAIKLSRPNLFCDWLSGMAADYNRFYRENHVITDDGINVQNLLLNELSRDHLRRGCEAVGIIPLEEM